MRSAASLTAGLFLAFSLSMAACSADDDSGGSGDGGDATTTGDAGDGASSDDGDAGADTGADTGATGGTDTGADTGGEGASGDSGATGGGDDGVAVTWHGDVRAIMESACVECHSDDGIGPFPLNSYASASTFAAAAAGAVSEGRMPPWMPDPGCHPITNERILTPHEVDAIVAWAGNGTPEGDPATYVAPEVPPGAALGAPTLEVDAGLDYSANGALSDDYRCLPLDHVFEQDTYITAVDVKPDQKAVVHHVLLYAVAAEDLGTLAAKDDADSGPGYTCFGGPGLSSQMVGGWVPGTPPFALPADTAIVVESGSKIVMQVHYNTLPLAGETPPPDRTSVQFWTLPAGETPKKALNFVPLANGGIDIPAGDPASVQEKTFPVPVPFTIVGSTPHMHMLGAEIRVEIQRKDGDTDCVIDVPRWDFNWQQFYLYPDDQPLIANLGDSLKLTCVYDNSAANQPVVGGQQQPPGDVTWGEGTLDEMCLNYLLVSAAFEGPGGAQCPTFPLCVDLCDTGDGGCYLGCLIADGAGCAECMVPAVTQCGTAHCPLKLAAVGSCVNGCEGSLQDCLLGPCSDEVDTLYSCLEPHMKAGSCDEWFSECGAEFSGGG